MKIKKINIIKNIGAFKEFEWERFCAYYPDGSSSKTIGEFWHKNIFLADNWSWKSTIVNVLKSVNKNTSNLPKNWEWWWVSQEVVLEIDRWNISFDWTHWSTQDLFDNIHIFDAEFIQNNVWDLHYLDSNSVSKKRGDHFFTIWNFKEKEEKLSSLMLRKADLNKTLQLPPWKSCLDKEISDTILDIEDEKEISNISNALEKSLADLKEKLTQLDQKQKNITQIKAIVFSKMEDYNADEFLKSIVIFWQKLTKLNFRDWEESSVRNLIKLIQTHSRDTCPVCDQVIKDEKWLYIEHIKGLIEESIHNEIEENEKSMNETLINIEKFLKSTRDFISEFDVFQKSYNDTLAKLKAYGDDSNYQIIEWPNFKVEDTYILKINELLSLVDEKVKSKSKIINFPIDTIEPIIKKIQEFYVSINQKLLISNSLLTNSKLQDTESLNELQLKIRWEISWLELKLKVIVNFTSTKKFYGEVKDFYEAEFSSLEWFYYHNAIEETRSLINQKFNEFVWKYGDIIKENIEELNNSISFDLCTLDWGISYGASRCWLHIKYKNSNIEKDLSDGEKRVIALAYFFALRQEEQKECSDMLKKVSELWALLIDSSTRSELKPDLWREMAEYNKKIQKIQSKIIVFDDPVSDFDANHKQVVAKNIHKIAEESAQLFVFTHDEKFFEYLWKDFGKWYQIQWRFSIQKVQQNSVIWMINKNQLELYESDLLEIYNTWTTLEYFRIRESTYKLRYCLEDWIKNKVLKFSATKFDELLKHLTYLNKWDDETVSGLIGIYSFCNLNWSHEGSSSWLNELQRNIELYFELKWTPINNPIPSTFSNEQASQNDWNNIPTVS